MAGEHPWACSEFDIIVRAGDVHRYEPDHAHRTIYVDCSELDQKVDKPDEGMPIKFSAEPRLSDNHNVGFRPHDGTDAAAIRIPKEAIHEYFVPNRTLLLRVTMHREQSDKLFRFRFASK